MASNEGGNGKGSPKIPLTAREQDELRRANKRKKKRSKGLAPQGATLFDSVREDRQAARDERELNRVFSATLKHLQRFGDQQMPGQSGQRPRWSDAAKADAARLLELYVFGPTTEEIELQESGMGDKIIQEVRRRLAGTCYLEKVHGTAAENLPWYAGELAESKAFHDSRYAKTAATTTAPAELVNA